MTTWYKASTWGYEIEAVEVIKVTDSFVTYLSRYGDNRREAKVSRYHAYCETHEKAEQWLRDVVDGQVSVNQAFLDHAKEQQAEIYAKFPPEEGEHDELSRN